MRSEGDALGGLEESCRTERSGEVARRQVESCGQGGVKVGWSTMQGTHQFQGQQRHMVTGGVGARRNVRSKGPLTLLSSGSRQGSPCPPPFSDISKCRSKEEPTEPRREHMGETSVIQRRQPLSVPRVSLNVQNGGATGAPQYG